MSVPRSDDTNAIAAVDAFLDTISRDSRPTLMLRAECDLTLGLASGSRHGPVAASTA